ncbi:MAG: NFACT RNA binding domain-containing protein [Spirochaetia bacterium]|nr:NFACT RNA binding domain-containing protein [Spirochaetia bacterium]
MSLNWKEIDLILKELPLERSHIQGVVQNTFHSMSCILYHPDKGRYVLYIDLTQNWARLHETTVLQKKSQKKLQRFPQMLRSRLIGGKITEAVHLFHDRIVRLAIHHGGENYFLYIRLWGGASNIIVTDKNHVIIDSYYRRPNKSETSGAIYNPELRSPEEDTVSADRFSIREHTDYSSFNTFIDYYYRIKELGDTRKQLLEQAEALISSKEAQLLKKLSGLEKKASAVSHSNRGKELGDLLSANLYRVSKGDTSVELEDFYHDNRKIHIPLDPSLSPSENAEKFYREYRKQKSAGKHIDQETENCRRQLKKIRMDRDTMALFGDFQSRNSSLPEKDNFSERKKSIKDNNATPSPGEKQQKEALKNLEESVQGLQELVSQYRSDKSKQSTDNKDTGGPPGLQFSSGGFTILVGRTAKENDILLRKFTRGNDYWFHTRDYPGGYVFIKYQKNKSVPLHALLDAGNLALFFSKGRSNGKADLYWTQVKHLRRAKHGKLGLVIPTQEKNMHIELDKKRIDKLFNGDRSSS